MRILIVDDEPTCRALMQFYLKEVGECEVAVNGSEAIHKFLVSLDEGKPYDLICLDILLPNINGQDVLATIREAELEQGKVGEDAVKVLITTGQVDPKNLFEAFHSGCESYLLKPIDKDLLYKSLEALGVPTSTK